MKKSLLLVLILNLVTPLVQAQCANPQTILFEDFEGGNPITGAVTANIYGGGSWTNAAYILSGSNHGWFNVINGIGDVDVYNRHLDGFCVDSIVDVSLWMRESYGGTNVTVSVEDDFGVILATTTINLNGVYQQITFSFPATTPGLNLIIHCNSTGGNGIDICVEDILVTHCYNPVTEHLFYSDCALQAPVDLFTLFSPAIAAGGTWSGPSALGNGDQGTFDPAVNTGGIYTYTDNSACVPQESTVEIHIPPTIDLGPDTTLCFGAGLTLNAGPGFANYDWSTGQTTQTIIVTQPGTYSVEAGFLMGNIVQNGDFEGGTTAAANNFTTSYIPGTGGPWGLLSNAGEYAITTSPNLVHNNFPACSDHTTGFGNMLVANGASTPNVTVWAQTVNVTPNTDYLFSFWAMRVSNDPSGSDLQLFVNGAAIGPINSTGAICNWQQVNDVWNSGAATTATLEIVNQSTSASGNDFALDDISFAPLCIITDTVVVDVETPVQTVTIIDPVCNGGADGEIHIDNSMAVEYSIDNGTTWQADSFFVNLSAGNYTVCSKSALGCDICEAIVIVDPSAVTLTLSADTTICENGTANLLASASGGTSFSYHWDFTGDTGASQAVNPTTTMTYSVYAENEFGCTSGTESVTVSLNPPLNGTISASVTICPGDQNLLSADATGGIGTPYTFSWSNGVTNTTQGTDVITVAPGVTTDYVVTVTDECETTPLEMIVTVEVAPLPEPAYMILSPDQCEPGVFEITNTTDPNLSQFVTWIVNGDEVYVNQETITTQEYMAGAYDLQMIVTSYEGCVDSMTFDDALVVYPSPTANFTFSPNPVTMFNTEVLFNNGSVGATYYQWFFEEGEPATASVQHPSTVFPDGEVGTYEVMLVAESDLGCFDTIVQTVQVYPEVILYAPNTFTPDGDAHNQNWRVFIEGIDTYNFELIIYNRWGEQVWISHDPEIGWDGTYQGYQVPDGMYTWTIEATDLLNDDKHTFNGHVNVLR